MRKGVENILNITFPIIIITLIINNNIIVG